MERGAARTRGAGYEKDAEKGNAAVLLGWAVLRFTTEMVESGEALATIERDVRSDEGCRVSLRNLRQQSDGTRTVDVDHEWCAECLQGVDEAILQTAWIGGPDATFEMKPCGHVGKLWGQP